MRRDDIVKVSGASPDPRAAWPACAREAGRTGPLPRGARPGNRKQLEPDRARLERGPRGGEAARRGRARAVPGRRCRCRVGQARGGADAAPTGAGDWSGRLERETGATGWAISGVAARIAHFGKADLARIEALRRVRPHSPRRSVRPCKRLDLALDPAHERRGSHRLHKAASYSSSSLELDGGTCGPWMPKKLPKTLPPRLLCLGRRSARQTSKPRASADPFWSDWA